MLQFTDEIEIQAPVEKVFSLLSDPRAMEQWFPGLENITFSSASNQVGSALKMTMVSREVDSQSEDHFDKKHLYEGKLTAYFENREYGFEFGNKDFLNQMLFRVQGSGSGSTRVQLEVNASYHNTMAERLARFFSWLMKGKLKSSLTGLKRVSEKGLEAKKMGKQSIPMQRKIAFVAFDLLVIAGILAWHFKVGPFQ